MSDDIKNNDDFAEFKPSNAEQENNDNSAETPEASNDQEIDCNDQTVESQSPPEVETVEHIVDKQQLSMGNIDEEDRLLCSVCHIGNVIAPFTLISGFISLIIYFVKEDEIIRFQAKQALIINLLWIAINIVVSIPLFLLSAVCCVTFPLLIFPWFALSIFSIYIAVKVYQGANYRVPYVSDWAEKLNF